MEKFLFYHHATSANHGCEAIVRTIALCLDEALGRSCDYTVASVAPENDRLYFTEKDGKFSFVNEEYTACMSKRNMRFFLGACSRVFRAIPFFEKIYSSCVDAAKKADAVISIGGDTYSYGPASKITLVDNKLRRLCPVSVLWGCSINPEMIGKGKYKFKTKGLANFSLITARESITYEALLNEGLTNVKLFPDPAFTLPAIEPSEPMFENGKDTVGINASPLIMKFENHSGIALKSYIELCRHILETTDFNIAFISHVIADNSSDTKVHEKFKEAFLQYADRIRIIDKGNAMELKGYISKCRFFIAARTHASIAAYSSCVPTLVVGYSVKSKGIAKDLFGAWDSLVLPIDSLCDERSLSDCFDKLVEREDEIRTRLNEIMPEYISRAKAAGREVAALINKKSNG